MATAPESQLDILSQLSKSEIEEVVAAAEFRQQTANNNQPIGINNVNTAAGFINQNFEQAQSNDSSLKFYPLPQSKKDESKDSFLNSLPQLLGTQQKMSGNLLVKIEGSKSLSSDSDLKKGTEPLTIPSQSQPDNKSASYSKIVRKKSQDSFENQKVATEKNMLKSDDLETSKRMGKGGVSRYSPSNKNSLDKNNENSNNNETVKAQLDNKRRSSNTKKLLKQNNSHHPLRTTSNINNPNNAYNNYTTGQQQVGGSTSIGNNQHLMQHPLVKRFRNKGKKSKSLFKNDVGVGEDNSEKEENEQQDLLNLDKEENDDDDIVKKKESETKVDAVERDERDSHPSVAVMSNHSLASRQSKLNQSLVTVVNLSNLSMDFEEILLPEDVPLKNTIGEIKVKSALKNKATLEQKNK